MLEHIAPNESASPGGREPLAGLLNVTAARLDGGSHGPTAQGGKLLSFSRSRHQVDIAAKALGPALKAASILPQLPTVKGTVLVLIPVLEA